MLEKRYGGRKKAQKAAETIQEAYRSYQMNKRYQHLKRTHSVESRISRYLDHHQQLRQTMQEWGMHSSRARVMVIEDNESPEEEGQAETKKAVKQLVKELNNADNNQTKSEMTPTRKTSVSSTRSAKDNEDHIHRNNSNNVTPKPGAITPSDGNEGPRLERKGSQTFVVTLTMCKHQDSESEDNIASEPSSSTSGISAGPSPKNTLTRESSKVKTGNVTKTTYVERTKEINKHGGVTMMHKESSTVRTSTENSETPNKATKKVLGEDSGVARKLDLGEEIGETEDNTPDSEHSSSAQASTTMSPCEDADQLAKVVWTESPLFRAEPPDFKAYTENAPDSSPESKPVAPLTVTAIETEMEATKMDDKPIRAAQDAANRQNNNQVGRKDKSRADSAGGDRGRTEGDKQRTQDGATSSDISPKGVAMETRREDKYKVGSESDDQGPVTPMTPVGADFDDKFDQLSVASTVTSDNEKDVPAVTVASPEGSMKILEEMGEESTSSSDSDMSDDEDIPRHRRKQQHAMQAIYNQQAARANKQFAKVHSNRMDSPVWKRKSMDTKIASSGGRGRIINGTPTPGRMTRSETGDSMSSESSGSSSKYTYEDTSSMADDSVDSLSGESSLFDGIERHVIPTQTQTLSIPMTPMRKRRYRIGVNLFNK